MGVLELSQATKSIGMSSSSCFSSSKLGLTVTVINEPRYVINC